jgi:hypothetical protein
MNFVNLVPGMIWILCWDEFCVRGEMNLMLCWDELRWKENKRKEKKRKEKKGKEEGNNGRRRWRGNRNTPGTNLSICTGWDTQYKYHLSLVPAALYRLDTWYNWELPTGTNACFSSSESSYVYMYSSASLRRRNALAPILYTTKLPTAHARCRLWRARVTVAMALRPLLLRCDCRRLEGISPTVLRLRPPPCLRLQLAQRKRSGWALCSFVLLTVPARESVSNGITYARHDTWWKASPLHVQAALQVPRYEFRSIRNWEQV